MNSVALHPRNSLYDISSWSNLDLLNPHAVRPSIEKHWEAASRDASSVSSIVAPSNNEKHYAIDLIRMHFLLESIAHQDVTTAEAQFAIDRTNIAQQEAAKEAAFQEYFRETRLRNRWSAISTVMQYLGEGAGLTCGAAIYTASPSLGMLLMASSVLNIGRRVLGDSNGMKALSSWLTTKDELRTRYANRLSLAMFFLTIGTGLAGGVGSCAQGVLSSITLNTNPVGVARKIIEASQVSTFIANSALKWKTSAMDQKLIELRVEAQLAEARVQETWMEVSERNSTTERMIETVQSIGSDLQSLIQESAIQD